MFSFYTGDGATFFGELQVDFKPCLQFRDDLRRPSVSCIVWRLSAQFCDFPANCGPDLFIASGHPLHEGTHGFGVKTRLRVSLTLGQLAFESNRGGFYEIWLASLEGSNLRQLTSFGALTSSPRWSPDGQQIAFDGNKTGKADVEVGLSCCMAEECEGRRVPGNTAAALYHRGDVLLNGFRQFGPSIESMHPPG